MLEKECLLTDHDVLVGVVGVEHPESPSHLLNFRVHVSPFVQRDRVEVERWRQ